MAELRDLYDALAALRDSGKTGRVSFFFNGDDGKMQSGHLVVEDGATCYLHLRDLAPDEALALIPGLRFAKVTTLPALCTDHSNDVTALPMATVLEQLDPATHESAPAAPAPVAAHVPMPALAAHAATASAAAPAKAHVFYSHLAMQKDALDLLESLFGTGAARKVEEFARQSPPHQYPNDFLGKCRNHAAMMLGARKAEELFAPLFDKLSH
jgi:hypothetical protein